MAAKVFEQAITQTCFPGRYIQGPKAIDLLPNIIADYGTSALLIVDPFVHKSILPEVSAKFGNTDINTQVFGGECSDEEIQRLVDSGKKAGNSSVIGFGGGKTLDTAKAVSYYLKAPIIIIPTIASTDAPCSARAVIYTKDGRVQGYLDLPCNPQVVLLDTSIIIKAPVRFLISGLGDALSTSFEAAACAERRAANSTHGAGHAHPGSLTAYALAQLCYNTLLKYGRDAVTSARAGATTPAFEHCVEANTLLSGVGFESGGLAAAHAIHNGLSELPECHAYMHGEKVAIGVLASLFLTDKPRSQIDEVYSFCEEVGLPTTLADLGVKEITDEKLKIVADRTCVSDETIWNEGSYVTVDAVVSALRAADAEGKRRKGIK